MAAQGTIAKLREENAALKAREAKLMRMLENATAALAKALGGESA